MSDVKHANGVESLDNISVEELEKRMEEMAKAPREEPLPPNTKRG